MRRVTPGIRRSVAFVCLLAMATLPACSQSPAGWTEEAIGQIDAVLEEAAGANGGCALVVLVGGEVVYENGFHGLTPDSVIPIVSASKWLAAATVMTLVDDGLLSLDDSVSELFPTLEEPLVLVRHLFSHTSGLPGNLNACTSWMTLGDCAAAIAGLRIATMPGKVFAYGELSMQIGGHLAELATGKSWHDLFAERLTEPLGMASTDYRTFGEIANPVVGGGAQSSALDYARFVQMLLDGGVYDGERVLSEEAVAEILTDQLVDTPIRPETVYGLGCWGYRVDSETHRLLLASSPGAYGFIPWIDTERNLAGVLAANSSYDAVDPTWERILAILNAAFPIP
ncbi:serine hydrolase domain-containing protein [Candidatus Bipolaricaulota bacterium]